MQQDGVIDSKTKDVKTRHECKLYVRTDEKTDVFGSFVPAAKRVKCLTTIMPIVLWTLIKTPASNG